MDAVHLHLLTNHASLFAALGGLALLLWGWQRGSTDLQKAALWFFAAAGAFILPAWFSGENAEEATEHLPWFMESLVEAHEDAALFALWATLVLGVLAAGALFYARRRPLPGALRAVILLAALVSLGAVAWTANLGGQIRHAEIRPAAAE